MKPSDSLEYELKQLIVTILRLEEISPQDIDSDQPLFNEGLGLDSIDGLELGMAISKTYKIELSHDPKENKHYFANVRNLVSFIRQEMAKNPEERSMISKDDIFIKIKEILMEFFELEESLVVLNAHLYQDLGLDSLDSIDLAVKFGADIGVKFTDVDLRSIRTISDIVEVVYRKLNTGKLLEI